MIGIVILNMVLKQTGHAIVDVSETEVVSLFETLLQLAIIIAGFWYNNSFSDKAKKADEFLKGLKKGGIE